MNRMLIPLLFSLLIVPQAYSAIQEDFSGKIGKADDIVLYEGVIYELKVDTFKRIFDLKVDT